MANALALDGNGNVIVTGRSRSTINDDYYTAKYAAADGSLLWEKRYNGRCCRWVNPLGIPPRWQPRPSAADLAVDANGNVLIAGSVLDISQDYLVLKITTALTTLQSWRLSNFGTTSNTGDAADTADFDRVRFRHDPRRLRRQCEWPAGAELCG